MTDVDTLLAEIVELAKHHSGASNVGADTRLYADLGLTGDDAHNFMTAFAAKYDVDMNALAGLRYFDDEGSDMQGPAITLMACALSPSFAARWRTALEAEREVTIAHLAAVARSKVWRDPGEAFRRAPKSAPLTLIFSALSLLTMAFFFLLGIVVAYGFLTGELGDRNLLTLFGIVAIGLFFPVYLTYVSWRNIERKLASAGPSAAAN